MKDKDIRQYISHFEIFNYWKDKAIKSNGCIVSTDDMEENDILVVEDWGEPTCWCCGKFIYKVYDLKLYDDYCKNGDYNKIWNCAGVRHNLNKCHIIPFSMDGDDTPNNLFLMCESCHIKSPDIINEKYFLNYVYKQRYNQMFEGISRCEFLKIVRRIQELADIFDKDYYNTFMNIKSIDDIRNFLDLIKKTRSIIASTHGSKFSYETIASIICECLDNKNIS